MTDGKVVHEALVIGRIQVIRGHKVMLDEDLADLYGIETRRLNEQVKRNPERFPEDFMFQLTEAESSNLMSQSATSSWGGRRTLPYAFTEHGVLMLSSVLSSPTAVQVNIQIMRVYTKLREMLLTHKDILLKLDQMEKEVTGHGVEIRMIFDALRRLMESPPAETRKRIGYRT